MTEGSIACRNCGHYHGNGFPDEQVKRGYAMCMSPAVCRDFNPVTGVWTDSAPKYCHDINTDGNCAHFGE